LMTPCISPPTVAAVPDARGTGEFAAIERIAALLGPPPAGEVWIGDDAAVVHVGGARCVIAADALVAGVHADLSLTSVADLGWKALVVNVSDVAAMGCAASRAVVTVAGPPATRLEELYEGLRAAAVEYACPIVGGDLANAPDLTVSVTVVGPGGVSPPPVLRSGARPGDEVWVTGPLGAAAAGLRALRAGACPPALRAAHARPVARVAEGIAARELGATAMIDVSDGFAADLGHVLDASGVGCALDFVPIAEGATEAEAIGGGDDYELVWCAPPEAGIAAGFAGRGLRPPIKVGRCVDDPAERPEASGWVHSFGEASRE
jgi:thiamine-monophosphate kinase